MTMSKLASSPYDSALPNTNLQSGLRQRAMSSISLDVSSPVAPGAVEKPVPHARSSTVASLGRVERIFLRTSRKPPSGSL